MQKLAFRFSVFILVCFLCGCENEPEKPAEDFSSINDAVLRSSKPGNSDLLIEKPADKKADDDAIADEPAETSASGSKETGDVDSPEENDAENNADAAPSSPAANKNDAEKGKAEKDGSKQEDLDSGQQSEGSDSKNVGTNNLANGLFPKIAANNSSPASPESRFGGGLFPVSANVTSTSNRSGTVSTTRNDDANRTMAKPMESINISLLPNARKFFDEHMEMEAINTIYANHLVSEQARNEYKLNWIPGLKEPRLLFRWGVGVVFNSPRDFHGRHPVIGDPGDENEGATTDGQTSNRTRRTNRSGGRSNPRGGSALGVGGGGLRSGTSGTRTYKNIDTSRPDGFLMYYTGDFGRKLINFLDSRRSDENAPYYGKILKDVMELSISESETAEDSQQSNRTAGRNNPGGAGLGLPAGRGPGARPPTGNSTTSNSADRSIVDRATGSDTATRPENDFNGSIIPGVDLLGVGSKAELIERSRAAGVDVMIMFNVKISESRGEYYSTTSMKIVDVNTEENLFSSKSLKDTKVAEDVEEGNDPVQIEVERAFASVADKQFKATKLPGGLTEENVKKRVGRLLKDKRESPLPAAVEIISYVQADLLSEQLASTAMSRLFGSDKATVLVAGTAKERLDYLKDWLPEESAN